MALTLIASILVPAALSLGRDLFIPIALALCFYALLRPVVRALEGLRVPTWLGATAVMLGMLVLLFFGGVLLSNTVSGFMEQAPASIAKAMKHVRDLVGIQYVALGSDYDGATTVRFDTSKLVQVTEALIEAGFTDDEIRAAMGGTAIRVLRAGLVPMAAAK